MVELKTWKDYLDLVHFVLIVVLIVASGLFGFNQFIKYRYYNQVMTDPCNTCQLANPNQGKCIGQCFAVVTLNPTYAGFKFNNSFNVSLGGNVS